MTIEWIKNNCKTKILCITGKFEYKMKEEKIEEIVDKYIRQRSLDHNDDKIKASVESYIMARIMGYSREHIRKELGQ